MPARAIAALLAVALALPLVALLASGAEAQERPRTLFEFLFPGRKEPSARTPEQAFPPRPRAPKQAERRKPRQSVVASETAPAAVQKADDARTVLVVGDFIAGGLAEGLSEVFAADATVRVVDRSSGASGLVRDDHYDWPGSIAGLIEAEKPAVVVVLVGSNDRQQILVGEARADLRTPEWNAEYSRRATRFASSVAAKGAPLIWVGLPAFKATKMASDMLAFNDIQQAAAEASGARFVDLWEGFVDADGAFVASGPDINGLPVRLRTNDGINFTDAGKRKLAFYVEKPLNRILQSGGSEAPGLAAPGQPVLDGLPAGAPAPVVDRTQPVSLFDPELDGGGELLGLVAAPPRGEARTPGEKLAIEGLAPEPAPGRVDDFAAPKPETAPPLATGERTSAIGAR